MTAAIAGSVISSVITRRGKKRQQSSIPLNIRTGFSDFNTKTGEINIDPSVRQGQEDFKTALGGFRGDIGTSFDEFNTGLAGLQERSAGLRENFEGNQSAFRAASLAPLQERIARGRGELDRELGRTGVRGSFANQQRTGFELDAGRDLSIREAEIENTRINKLGDFLGMDAALLKEGLASDTGRLKLLASLEESLLGVSTERFNQELSLLGLPANFIGGTSQNAANQNTSQGLIDQADANLVGDLFADDGSSFDGGSAFDSSNSFGGGR